MTPSWPQRLRDARQQAGWTQRRLGQAAGVSAESVAKYEAGTRRPRRATLLRIARALALSPTATDQLLAAAAVPAEPAGRLDRLRGIRGTVAELTAAAQDYPWPCLIINERYEIMGWNQAAEVVAEFDFATGLPEPWQRNFLRIALHDHFKPRVGNWDAVISQLISMYKSHQSDPAQSSDAPYFGALMQEVLTGPYAGDLLRLWGGAEPFQEGTRVILPIEWRPSDGTVLLFNTVFTLWSDYDAAFAHDWHPADATTWEWLATHQPQQAARTALPAATEPVTARPWHLLLRSARTAARLTRQQLAAASGVAVDTLFSWESGRRTPTVERFVPVARALALDTVTTNAILSQLGVAEELQPSDWALFVAGLPPRNGSTWYETAGAVHRSWEQIAEDIAPLPWPCLVLNERCDVTQWNGSAARVLGADITANWERPRERSLIRVLLSPPVRRRLHNWAEAVQALVPATLVHAAVEADSAASPYRQGLRDLQVQLQTLIAEQGDAKPNIRTVIPWHWQAPDGTALRFTAIATAYNALDPAWVVDLQPADATTWQWLHDAVPSP